MRLQNALRGRNTTGLHLIVSVRLVSGGSAATDETVYTLTPSRCIVYTCQHINSATAQQEIENG